MHEPREKRQSITIPTIAEIRAAQAQGISLSSASIREQRAKAKTKRTSSVVTALQTENAKLKTDLQSSRQSERDLLNRLAKTLAAKF